MTAENYRWQPIDRGRFATRPSPSGLTSLSTMASQLHSFETAQYARHWRAAAGLRVRLREPTLSLVVDPGTPTPWQDCEPRVRPYGHRSALPNRRMHASPRSM